MSGVGVAQGAVEEMVPGLVGAFEVHARSAVGLRSGGNLGVVGEVVLGDGGAEFDQTLGGAVRAEGEGGGPPPPEDDADEEAEQRERGCARTHTAWSDEGQREFPEQPDGDEERRDLDGGGGGECEAGESGPAALEQPHAEGGGEQDDDVDLAAVKRFDEGEEGERRRPDEDSALRGGRRRSRGGDAPEAERGGERERDVDEEPGIQFGARGERGERLNEDGKKRRVEVGPAALAYRFVWRAIVAEGEGGGAVDVVVVAAEQFAGLGVESGGEVEPAPDEERGEEHGGEERGEARGRLWRLGEVVHKRTPSCAVIVSVQRRECTGRDAGGDREGGRIYWRDDVSRATPAITGTEARRERK